MNESTVHIAGGSTAEPSRSGIVGNASVEDERRLPPIAPPPLRGRGFSQPPPIAPHLSAPPMAPAAVSNTPSVIASVPVPEITVNVPRERKPMQSWWRTLLTPSAPPEAAVADPERILQRRIAVTCAASALVLVVVALVIGLTGAPAASTPAAVAASLIVAHALVALGLLAFGYALFRTAERMFEKSSPPVDESRHIGS